MRHTISMSLHTEKVRRGISRAHPWETSLSLQLFLRCPANTSENFDSCSTSVSSHCMTATWSSFTFLMRFGDVSLAIDAACSTTDLGLNLCVTANQGCNPSLGLTLRILLTSVATVLAGARDQSNCHSCTQLLDVSEGPPPRFQSCCLQTFPAWQPLSTAHPVNHVIGLPHSPPSEMQNHQSQDGFHRIAVASVSQLPCGSVSGRAVNLNLTWL